MAIIGQGVSLEGMTHNDFHYPFLLAAAVVAADVGKPMAVDVTAPNTLKVAADGEQILGRLETFEDRTIEGIKVGAVSIRGGWSFPITGTVAVGDTVVGAGGGNVRAAVEANHADNVVVQVAAGRATIIR